MSNTPVPTNSNKTGRNEPNLFLTVRHIRIYQSKQIQHVCLVLIKRGPGNAIEITLKECKSSSDLILRSLYHF